MHVVDGVPKKQIAERLGLDIKTVRRAVAQAAAPARRAVSRPRHLDRWRAQIEQWLRQDRRLTAKRIRRLLLPLAGPVAERTVRWYVARLKAAAAPKDVYVHRSPRPGVTLEVDFGESWAEVAGVLRKVKYVVARYCQVDEKLVDRPPRYWVLARREPTMLGIKTGRQPQLDNTVAPAK